MSLITGKYFDLPAYESGFEQYEPFKTTKRRFFQSVVGKWNDELNVVDSRVEMSREAYRHQVCPQDLVGLVNRVGQNTAYGEDKDEDEDDDDDVVMSADP